MTNVIAFDTARKATRAASAKASAKTTAKAAKGFRNNVVSISDWKSKSRARRTAAGVFFTTGVLCTFGDAA